jgi:hypothetical protein
VRKCTLDGPVARVVEIGTKRWRWAFPHGQNWCDTIYRTNAPEMTKVNGQ